MAARAAKADTNSMLLLVQCVVAIRHPGRCLETMIRPHRALPRRLLVVAAMVLVVLVRLVPVVSQVADATGQLLVPALEEALQAIRTAGHQVSVRHLQSQDQRVLHIERASMCDQTCVLVSSRDRPYIEALHPSATNFRLDN